jgi:hypothetical protein
MGKDGPDPSPKVVTRPWTNPRTGETHQVPVGVDPGFDYNMGKAWKQGRAAELPVRAPNLRPLGPREPQPTDKQLDAIRDFVRDPRGSVPVGRLEDAARAAIRAHTDEVLLSEPTVEKQGIRHPDLTVDDYLLLPLVLGTPSLVILDGDRHVILLQAGARLFAAVVKTTEPRTENYVVSFHRAHPADVRRWLRRGKVVSGDAEKWRADGASP